MHASNRRSTWIFLLALLLAFWVRAEANPINASATQETRSLLAYLNSPAQPAMIGSAYGGSKKAYGWKEQFNAGGRYPAVYAIEYYDAGPVEMRPDAREEARQIILAHFAAGGVVSLHDHVYNFALSAPVDLTDAYRNRSVDGLAAILPGGDSHAAYVAYLDRLASFVQSLSVNGVKVPVLYRPFHEMNGKWFWWGGESSADNLVSVWQFTVDYLVKTKGCNNLLFVWSPNISAKASVEYYSQFWPGSNYVDVVGIDGYDNGDSADFANAMMRNSYAALLAVAKNNHKPLAWAEIGFEKAARSSYGFWFDNVLASLKKYYPEARYFTIWNHVWGPEDGNVASESFRKLVDDSSVTTLDKVRRRSIYGH